MKGMKKVFSAVLFSILLIGVGGCGSSEPCADCGNTPTKAYKNTSTGENEYYCEKCASDCAFSSKKATKHYTSAAGIIIFACNDCYKDIMENQ